MTAGAELGSGMPVRHQTSSLVFCQTIVSLLPAPYRFFFDGSTDVSIASKPKPQSTGLEMSSSSFSSLMVVFSPQDGYPSHLNSTHSLLQSNSLTHCLLALPGDSSGHLRIYLFSPWDVH